MRDPENGASKGYGFVSYDSFDSSDQAIAAMNGRDFYGYFATIHFLGQYFCNKTIHVSYAYKKDTKGERHGSTAGNNLVFFLIQ